MDKIIQVFQEISFLFKFRRLVDVTLCLIMHGVHEFFEISTGFRFTKKPSSLPVQIIQVVHELPYLNHYGLVEIKWKKKPMMKSPFFSKGNELEHGLLELSGLEG